MIQLFDLSVLPKNHSSDNHDKVCSSLPSLMQKGRRDTLFSLGTLLYRLAHRLSLSKVSPYILFYIFILPLFHYCVDLAWPILKILGSCCRHLTVVPSVRDFSKNV